MREQYTRERTLKVSDIDPELKALLEQVDRPVVPWNPRGNPEIGAKVGGKVVDITRVENTEYQPYTLLIIETPDEILVGVHCFHTVLKKEIERRIGDHALNVGDTIAIAYHGHGEAKHGNNAPEMYRVAIKPAS